MKTKIDALMGMSMLFVVIAISILTAFMLGWSTSAQANVASLRSPAKVGVGYNRPLPGNVCVYAFTLHGAKQFESMRVHGVNKSYRTVAELNSGMSGFAHDRSAKTIVLDDGSTYPVITYPGARQQETWVITSPTIRFDSITYTDGSNQVAIETPPCPDANYGYGGIAVRPTPTVPVVNPNFGDADHATSSGTGYTGSRSRNRRAGIAAFRSGYAQYLAKQEGSHADEAKLALAGDVVLDTCPAFTEYLFPGDTGDAVLSLQSFLNDQLEMTIAEDGIYGPETTAAVAAFQETHTDVLDVWNYETGTGNFYQSTRHKANELVGCSEGYTVLDNGTAIH